MTVLSCGICEKPIDGAPPDDGNATTLCLECAAHPALVRAFTEAQARKAEAEGAE
jgi:hypothetical protein